MFTRNSELCIILRLRKKTKTKKQKKKHNNRGHFVRLFNQRFRKFVPGLNNEKKDKLRIVGPNVLEILLGHFLHPSSLLG